MSILHVPLTFTQQEDMQISLIFRKNKTRKQQKQQQTTKNKPNKNPNKQSILTFKSKQTRHKQTSKNTTKNHPLQQLKSIYSLQSGHLSKVEDDLLPTVNKSYMLSHLNLLQFSKTRLSAHLPKIRMSQRENPNFEASGVLSNI